MIARTLVNALFFASFFLMLTAGINRLIARLDTRPFPGVIQSKFNYFAEHKDEFDVIFVGSSHIAMQIDPRTFDTAMSEFGRLTNSFNFGIDGMTPFEVEVIVRKIMDLEPARLRWCIIDAAGWGHVIGRDEPRAFTKRTIWWHTPHQTYWAIRSILSRDLPAMDKMRLSCVHLNHFFLKALPVGRVVHWKREISRKPRISEKAVAATRGFFPMRIEMTKFVVARMSADSPTALEFRHHEDICGIPGQILTENRARNNILIYEVTPANRIRFAEFEKTAYAKQIARISKMGLEPIFLIPPRLFLYDRYKPPRSLDFTDPLQYSDLFAVRNRSDPDHLTAKAALDYSRLVASGFHDLTGEPEISER